MQRTRFGSLPRRALLLAVLGTLLSSSPAAAVDVLSDPRVLDARLMQDRFAAGEPTIPVIVCLEPTVEMRTFRSWKDASLVSSHRASVAGALERAVAAIPGTELGVERRLENVPIFSGAVTSEGLRRLLADPSIRSIELNRPLTLSTSEGIGVMNATLPRAVHGGAGVSIGIVDSGVDYTHPALGGGAFPNAKVIGGFDFGENDADPMDNVGHGTSCAAVATGLNVPDGSYVGGAAPAAKVYALKITDAAQALWIDAAISSWDWCITHQYDDPANPILVISNSFGSGSFSQPCTVGAYAATAQAVVNAGITLFVASGNDGFTSSMQTPACDPNTISVGAVYDADVGGKSFPDVPCTDFNSAADQVTCYSNSAWFLDLLAPSDNAWVPQWGGGFHNFNGTSAATPYAAGAAAILISASSALQQSLTPQQIRSILVSTGNGILDPKSGITTSRVNLTNAIDSLADVWVNQLSPFPFPNGSWSLPYLTLGAGLSAVPAGGSVATFTGSYKVPQTINQPVTIKGYGGAVTLHP